MTSMSDFVMKIKPALEIFLRNPRKDNLHGLEKELSNFTWAQLQIFNVQILLPLVIKLESLNGADQDLQTGTMNCIKMVISKLYLKDVQGLKTMLVIILKQIRDCDRAATKANLSEEIKLAAVETIYTILQRSTSDVLEQYYTQESSLFLGQILLTLVEFVQREKYRKLVIASLNCIMAVFYVHDSAEVMDVVLRGQVADTLFIFLPKIVTMLLKICLSDEKHGETLITTAVKALGRILCVVFEETDEEIIKTELDVDSFKKLIEEVKINQSTEIPSDNDVLGTKAKKEEIEKRLKQMQTNGRDKFWIGATSRKLRVLFRQIGTLCSHNSVRIRLEYARMICTLTQKCPNNLKDSFIFLLENVIAMAEDDDAEIATLCKQTLISLQCCKQHNSLFDESAELLFDEHLTKLPRIISRCDDAEQHAEFLFLKGFLRNLSANKLQILFSLERNLEIFCACLLAAVDLQLSRDLLAEEYALRMVGEHDFEECAKLHWRKFKHINSQRCVIVLQEICSIMGSTDDLNHIIFNYLLEMLRQQNQSMNEVILLMLWMGTNQNRQQIKSKRIFLVEQLLNEVLKETHWHLSLEADQMWRLKVNKPTDWFVDRTPGLYESAVEIRLQDCDSDDENEENDSRYNFVSVADAQFNVLHTCIVLDALGHCAIALGESFENYLFRSLHKVLLKVGASNSIIYKSANFALISMQRALKFPRTTHFIESYTDYITYHLNRILKKKPESKSAVDILTVVLQLCTKNALPHLESIFQTIREECSKSYQSQNVISYLRVFMAFLSNVSKWQNAFYNEIKVDDMQVDVKNEDKDVLKNWLEIYERTDPTTTMTNGIDAKQKVDSKAENDNKMDVDSKEYAATAQEQAVKDKVDSNLPQHIQVVKDILEQVSKFVSSKVQSHQILSLECLICGLPLLHDYEDDLLPLVHRLWQPLVERFRQKDAIVLNRCFELLGLLALNTKEFISKRSLDDVIPFLKRFLKEAAVHSQAETSLAHTQEFKLQVKLLQEFSNLIQNMQIDGKHLNEISDVISLYLSNTQPEDLQRFSVQYFKSLLTYNGPLVYLVVLKKAHLNDFKENVSEILKEFNLK